MRTFHTKVGWWYWGIIALFSCFLFVCFWFHELLLTLLFAVIVIFLIEALIHTQYVVTADGKLVIEVGRFMKGASIDVAQIVSIEKANSPNRHRRCRSTGLKLLIGSGLLKIIY